MKGSGLGLAIARSLVEMHRGSLRIRSRVGKGTVVMIHLPAPDARSGGCRGGAPPRLFATEPRLDGCAIRAAPRARRSGIRGQLGSMRRRRALQASARSSPLLPSTVFEDRPHGRARLGKAAFQGWEVGQAGDRHEPALQAAPRLARIEATVDRQPHDLGHARKEARCLDQRETIFRRRAARGPAPRGAFRSCSNRGARDEVGAWRRTRYCARNSTSSCAPGASFRSQASPAPLPAVTSARSATISRPSEEGRRPQQLRPG